MARPTSRRDRRDEPPPRRGRSNGGRGGGNRPGGAPVAILAIGAAVIVAGAIVGLSLSGKGKEKPKEAPAALGPAPKESAAPAAPKETPKEPPKPLTPEEKTWIDGLFRQAEPHMALFKKLAAEGWALKEEGDEAAANEVGVKAKKEAQKAIGIVSEALEDYDRFPEERQLLHMQSYNSRLTQWQKDLAALYKVHVDK